MASWLVWDLPHLAFVSTLLGFYGFNSLIEDFSIVTKRQLVFDGRSTNPQDWHYGYVEMKTLVADFVAESAFGTGESAYVLLAIGEGMESIVSDYLQYVAFAMISFPGAEVTRNIEGSYVVIIGDTTSIIEFEGSPLERGFLRRVLRIVSGATVVAGIVTGNVPVIIIGVNGIIVSIFA